MTFEQSIVTCLRKYAGFEGRASRAEYWWFQVFIVVAVAASVILGSLSDIAGAVLMLCVGFGLVLPSFAATVRRMHDVGWSGWWILASVLPFGGIALLAILAWPGTPGANRFGDAPQTGPAPLVPFDALDASFDDTRIPRVRPRKDDL
ncbi:MAG: DUF805 domain-containing protein [Jannaschia sp.]